MISTLLPSFLPDLDEVEAANSPFHQLSGFTSRTEFNQARALPASERRQMNRSFRDCFTWETILPLLPLRLVVPEEVPPLASSSYAFPLPMVAARRHSIACRPG